MKALWQVQTLGLFEKIVHVSDIVHLAHREARTKAQRIK